MKNATNFIHEGWSLASYINVLLVLSVRMSCLEEVVVEFLLERTLDQGVRRLASPLILGLPGSFDFLM